MYAADRVFGIAELLQNVFENLSEPDLFRLQFVDRTWYTSITRGQLLQNYYYISHESDATLQVTRQVETNYRM